MGSSPRLLLGTLLFILCPSELFNVLEAHLPSVHCYADDTQLYLSFRPNENHGEDDALKAIELCVQETDRQSNILSKTYRSAMATRFWSPVLLVFLVCMFKHKWNLVGGDHNSNAIHTVFSLSVIEERVIRSIWCLASFDSQLHNHCSRWRRYKYGIRPGFISLLLLRGEIELNRSPAHNLKVAYFNARSLVNKSASLEVDVYSKTFDIIVITEKHLDETINSVEFFSSNFRIYRRD